MRDVTPAYPALLLCIITYITIVRQSDARWCERTAANHRLLLDWLKFSG